MRDAALVYDERAFCNGSNKPEFLVDDQDANILRGVKVY